jgi:hypothetical protein
LPVKEPFKDPERLPLGHQAKSIVIEPELDVWMWGSDNAVEETIGWPPGKTIRQWLKENDFEFHSNEKPRRPKEAMESVMRMRHMTATNSSASTHLRLNANLNCRARSNRICSVRRIRTPAAAGKNRGVLRN